MALSGRFTALVIHGDGSVLDILTRWFEASGFARALLGAELHRLFALVKRHELDEFNRQVTPGEIACLLPAI